MNILKWSALAALVIVLLGMLLMILDHFDISEVLGVSVQEVTNFLTSANVYIYTWRGVLNIFCNPLILNLGLGIWLLYPVYVMFIKLIKVAVNFILR